VAAFCTRCGAALAPSVQFCSSCGAPAGAPTSPPSLYGQPAVAPVQPAPSGSSLVKVILIVVGVVVGLGLLSAIAFMFSVWRLSRGVHVTGSGDVVVATPNGTVSTGNASTVSDADLGVPIYPGASRREGGMRINSTTGSMVTVVFSTPDPVSKVVDFYRTKLGENTSVMQSGTGAVISAGEQNKQGVIITIGTDTGTDGGTKIAIMRTKSK
jgi:zinc-ribbon domain